VKNGDVRLQSGNEHQTIHLLGPVEGIVHENELFGRQSRVLSPVFFAVAPLVDDIRSEGGVGWKKRNTHGPGHEPQGHLVVRVVFNGDFPFFRRSSETKAGGSKPAGTAIGDVNPRDTAAADQFINRLTVGA